MRTVSQPYEHAYEIPRRFHPRKLEFWSSIKLSNWGKKSLFTTKAIDGNRFTAFRWRVILSKTYHNLHRLSELVGLGPLSIELDSKSFENLTKSLNRGSSIVPQLNWILARSSISNDRSLEILPKILLVEVMIFYSRSFFLPCSAFLGNCYTKMLIFDIF